MALCIWKWPWHSSQRLFQNVAWLYGNMETPIPMNLDGTADTWQIAGGRRDVASQATWSLWLCPAVLGHSLWGSHKQGRGEAQACPDKGTPGKACLDRSWEPAAGPAEDLGSRLWPIPTEAHRHPEAQWGHPALGLSELMAHKVRESNKWLCMPLTFVSFVPQP